jgi:hypothetical protein
MIGTAPQSCAHAAAILNSTGSGKISSTSTTGPCSPQPENENIRVKPSSPSTEIPGKSANGSPSAARRRLGVRLLCAGLVGVQEQAPRASAKGGQIVDVSVEDVAD